MSKQAQLAKETWVGLLVVLTLTVVLAVLIVRRVYRSSGHGAAAVATATPIVPSSLSEAKPDAAVPSVVISGLSGEAAPAAPLPLHNFTTPHAARRLTPPATDRYPATNPSADISAARQAFLPDRPDQTRPTAPRYLTGARAPGSGPDQAPHRSEQSPPIPEHFTVEPQDDAASNSTTPAPAALPGTDTTDAVPQEIPHRQARPKPLETPRYRQPQPDHRPTAYWSQDHSEPAAAGNAEGGDVENVYVVREGDTLYDIARFQLGHPSRWVEIHELNRRVIAQNPDFLRPGTRILLPAEPASESTSDRSAPTRLR